MRPIDDEHQNCGRKHEQDEGKIEVHQGCPPAIAQADPYIRYRCLLEKISGYAQKVSPLGLDLCKLNPVG